jgi:hypothetical protein
MARTVAPLLGLEASGTIGNTLVFSRWRGRLYVRRRVIPANPKSGLQVGMRSVLRFVTQDFVNLTDAQKQNWANLAAADNITELNAYVRDAQTRARRNQGWRRDPTLSPGTAPDAPSVTVTAMPKSLKVSWTAGVMPPDYAWLIHLSTSSGFTPDISNLIRAVPDSDSEYTIPGLTTGTTYYIIVRGLEAGGTFGANSTEASGTPT